ncbi:MAG: hypothetical protein K2W82_04415 [Candidatus Obscuribacterales bacterium]|nr:hypothetical protein [Candidatus Obscuribacterales bacterium]
MKNFIPAFLALTVAISGSTLLSSPVMAGENCPKKEGCKDKAKTCKHKKDCNKAKADDCCKDKDKNAVKKEEAGLEIDSSSGPDAK